MAITYLKKSPKTSSTDDTKTTEIVKDLLKEIENSKEEACINLTKKFDKYDGEIIISKERIEKIKKELDQIGINDINPNLRWIKKQHYLQKKLTEIVPSLDLFIDHIEYIIKLIGIDYVAIGSDYDGLDCLPKGWNSCLDHIKISELLDQKGYSFLEIEKIMGKNFLRLLENYFK